MLAASPAISREGLGLYDDTRRNKRSEAARAVGVSRISVKGMARNLNHRQTYGRRQVHWTAVISDKKIAAGQDGRYHSKRQLLDDYRIWNLGRYAADEFRFPWSRKQHGREREATGKSPNQASIKRPLPAGA